MDVDEALPRVDADAGLLERALANVIANAITASPPEQHVRVVAGRAGDLVDIRVADRGPGVTVEQSARMFIPFQRLGDAAAGEGVGLGLAVARGFVESMGGTLEVEETPGGGLTMVFRLRVAQ